MVESMKEYVKFLINEKITPNQYLICMFVGSKDWANAYQWTEHGLPFKRSEVEDLVRRGLIAPSQDPTENGLDSYSMPEDVKPRFIIVNTDPGVDFWEAYPPFMWIDGRKVPLKGTSRDDFEDKYNKRINGNLVRHRRIMRALNYAKAHNQVNIGIEKWFGGEMWVEILKEMDRFLQVKPEGADVSR